MAYLTIVQSEPSYLAGAAAARKSTTGVIGFVGGVDWEGIWGFQAGYEAGARAVDPDIDIRSPTERGDFTGFGDTDGAKAAALEMYRHGADVVFHAAGTPGWACSMRLSSSRAAAGRQVWAIGVDTDQFETVMRLPGATDATAWQVPHPDLGPDGIDTMTYAVVADHARGTFRPGAWKWGLASGAIGISYSGGYIDDIRRGSRSCRRGSLPAGSTCPAFPRTGWRPRPLWGSARPTAATDPAPPRARRPAAHPPSRPAAWSAHRERVGVA